MEIGSVSVCLSVIGKFVSKRDPTKRILEMLVMHIKTWKEEEHARLPCHANRIDQFLLEMMKNF